MGLFLLCSLLYLEASTNIPKALTFAICLVMQSAWLFIKNYHIYVKPFKHLGKVQTNLFSVGIIDIYVILFLRVCWPCQQTHFKGRTVRD